MSLLRQRMPKRARETINAARAIAWTGFVATAVAITNAWLVQPRKKAEVSMGFADPSNTIRIPTTIAPLAHVTGKMPARTTTAWPARLRRNACRTIVSTAFVAAISAWALAKRVRRRKKAAASMAFAAISPIRPTPITNASQANVMAPAREMHPPNQTWPTVQPSPPPPNALRVFALMEYVAIAGVWERAKRVRRRRKTKVSMGFADPLPMTKTPTKNAGAARAMATIPANNTTAYLVRTKVSACPGIASMDSAAAISAVNSALRVLRPKKAKDSTAYADRLPPVEI